jgi:hypothetical protein
MKKKLQLKHGQCIYYWPDPEEKGVMGQCLCPVPPQFEHGQAYNTIWAKDGIDSHKRGYPCPCFKAKK